MPLLSWRVQLLPMLGEQELYDEFHLDEAWDSTHNIQLLGRMPEVYGEEGAETGVQVFAGSNTPFVGSTGIKAADIVDGQDDTIMLIVVGADNRVPWTMPADVSVNETAPIASPR